MLCNAATGVYVDGLFMKDHFLPPPLHLRGKSRMLHLLRPFILRLAFKFQAFYSAYFVFQPKSHGRER